MALIVRVGGHGGGVDVRWGGIDHGHRLNPPDRVVAQVSRAPGADDDVVVGARGGQRLVGMTHHSDGSTRVGSGRIWRFNDITALSGLVLGQSVGNPHREDVIGNCDQAGEIGSVAAVIARGVDGLQVVLVGAGTIDTNSDLIEVSAAVHADVITSGGVNLNVVTRVGAGGLAVRTVQRDRGSSSVLDGKQLVRRCRVAATTNKTASASKK